jgi:sugar/nucleoside kinase (ribokinase family)
MQRCSQNSARFDAIGVGFYSVDHLCVVPNTPGLNQKVRIKKYELQTGGQTATAMVALQKWGLRTGFVGKVGDDSLGKLTVKELDMAGVDTSCMVLKKGGISHFAFIMVDSLNAARTIAWYREEQMYLSASELVEDYIKSAKMLHVDGYEMDAALCAARWAKEVEAFVVMDAECMMEGMWELLKYVDALVCTKEFAYQVTSCREPMDALQSLRKKVKSSYIVITLGEEGCVGMEGEDEPLKVPSCNVGEVVDTTGAGDVFHAGFLYGYHRGWELKKTLEFCCAAAALKCRSLGARRGIPALSEVFAHLKWFHETDTS